METEGDEKLDGGKFRWRWNRVRGKLVPVDVPGPQPLTAGPYEPRGLNPSHVRQFIPLLVAATIGVDVLVWFSVRDSLSTGNIPIFGIYGLTGLTFSQVGLLAWWVALARPFSVARGIVTLFLMELWPYTFGLLFSSDRDPDASQIVAFAIPVTLLFAIEIFARRKGLHWTYKPPDETYEVAKPDKRFQFSLAQMFPWTTAAALYCACLRLFEFKQDIFPAWHTILAWGLYPPLMIFPTWLVFGETRFIARLFATILQSITVAWLMGFTAPNEELGGDWYYCWFVLVIQGWTLISLAVVRMSGYRLRWAKR